MIKADFSLKNYITLTKILISSLVLSVLKEKSSGVSAAL